MKIVYIAGKFRGPTAWDIEQNIRVAEEMGLAVAAEGAVPLIPHTLYRYFHGQLTEQFWIEATLDLLRKCDAVLMVGKWRSSQGARGERAEADKLGIPVFEDFDELSDWLAACGPNETIDNA